MRRVESARRQSPRGSAIVVPSYACRWGVAMPQSLLSRADKVIK